MEALVSANDVLFVLLGAIMVLAMHAGFAFLEVGTVRQKNQVNALVKIMVDFCVSLPLSKHLLHIFRQFRIEQHLRAVFRVDKPE